MGGVFSFLFGSREPQTPIKSPVQRISNLFIVHFRGILGALVPLIVMGVMPDPELRYKSVVAIWISMFWLFLLQPIPMNATGLVAIFAFPMWGILTSDQTVDCLFNEHILLFFLAGWLLFTLNCCGVDKRIALFFLSSGGNEGYSAIKILLKSTMAAFILSMICNRMLAVAVILDVILPPLEYLASYSRSEANYKEYIPILCNAIATSATMGSMCVIHASLTTLQFKAMFAEILQPTLEFPDIFNYLQYSAYAVPTAVAMFIVNTIYHIVLIKTVVERQKPMSKSSMNSVKNAITKSKNSNGAMTNHQKVSSVLLALCYICMYTRWSAWLSMGWSTFRREVVSPEIPGVKDATTAAIFVFIFHLLPKSLDFIKIFTVKQKTVELYKKAKENVKKCGRKKHEMKIEKDAPLKMESGVLFFKYIDKNTDYSYFYVMGGAMALYQAVSLSGLIPGVTDLFGQHITGLDWNVGILIVVLLSAVLANIVSGCGAQAVIMPLFVAMAYDGPNPWPERMYLVLLGTGLATSFGFTIPFRDTTCYFTKTMAKVPLLQQVKYAVVSVLVCSLILYVTLTFYAPVLWDPNDTGVIGVLSPSVPDDGATTTAATGRV